jgi:predicted transcriptional regulator
VTRRYSGTDGSVVRTVRMPVELEQRIIRCAERLNLSRNAVMVKAMLVGIEAVEREAEEWERFQSSRRRRDEPKR